MNEQKQVTPIDNDLQAFLFRFQKIEDRLVLACLPVVIFSLILWTIATAFPIVNIVLNLIINILLLLVTCVVCFRLVEIAWRWAILSWQSGMEMLIGGVIGIGVLLIAGVVCLIDVILHAGIASPSRIGLFVGLLFVLLLQYRAIIYRHLHQTEEK